MTSSRPETLAARRIHTHDSAHTRATHAAVRDGRILAVGDRREALDWGYPINDAFADCVLMPGFIEAHGHLVAGGIWDYVYVGADERIDPDGRRFTGLVSNDAVVERMRNEAGSGERIIGWGFDPLFIDDERLDRRHLDSVNRERPVAILHSNMHVMSINSAALALAGYTKSSDVPGVMRGADGEPTGELREFAAMFPVMRRLGIDFGDLGNSPRALDRYARLAVLAGVTTVSDMLNDLSDDTVDMLGAFVDAGNSPIRLMAALNALGGTPITIRDRARHLASRSTDRLRLGATKIMTDGSIQAFTAQIKPPGYLATGGDPMWNIAPAQLAELVDVLHQGGVQMHIHVNGDLAIEVTIDALESAVARHPRWSHHHTLQHFQMADDSQIRRLKSIGGGANLFANHVYYFGDQHRDVTLGAQRAARIDPCNSALAAALPFAIHSDTPVTPLSPLFTAGCAMHRRTRTGQRLGESQCIPAQAAMRAITLGAAWTLGMENEIGSIAPGKRADFAVLADDPLDPDVIDPGTVGVIGTLSDGIFFAA